MMSTDTDFEVFLLEEASRAGVSRAEKAAFIPVMQGREIPEVAEELNVKPAAIRQRLSLVYKKFAIDGVGPVKSNKLQNLLLSRYRDWQKQRGTHPGVHLGNAAPPEIPQPVQPDWGDAPELPEFCGRTVEQKTLEQWIVGDRCRLVALLGLTGIGKTALAKKVADEILRKTDPVFDRIIWRSISLSKFKSLDDLLDELIKGLAAQFKPESDTEGKIEQLLEILHRSRCLIILDSVNNIIKSGGRLAGYIEGYEQYGTLLHQIGSETTHQSCLFLISQYPPNEVTILERKTKSVHSQQLSGLEVEDAKSIFKSFDFSDRSDRFKKLVKHLQGNPFLLKSANRSLDYLFSGNLDEFLEFITSRTTIHDGLFKSLLEEQFKKMSAPEQLILRHIAAQPEPSASASLEDIKKLDGSQSISQLMEILLSLKQWSWIETKSDPSGTRYFIPSLILNYLKKYQVKQSKN